MRSSLLQLTMSAVLIASAVGCDGDDGPDPNRERGNEPFLIDEAIVLTVIDVEGLETWHEDVLLTCRPSEGFDEGDDAENGCDVRVVTSEGTVEDTGITGVMGAGRITNNRSDERTLSPMRPTMITSAYR